MIPCQALPVHLVYLARQPALPQQRAFVLFRNLEILFSKTGQSLPVVALIEVQIIQQEVIMLLTDDL
jgi:hypothetical protein